MNDGNEFIRGAIMTASAAAGGQAKLAKALGVCPTVICKYIARGVLPAKFIEPVSALAGVPYTLEAVVMAAYRAKIGG